MSKDSKRIAILMHSMLRGDCACISATISELSIPPDKKAPRGTSDIIRRRIESLSKASKSSTSSGLSGSGSAMPRVTQSRRLQ